MPDKKKSVKAEVKKRPKPGPLYRKGWPKTMQVALYFNRKRRRGRAGS